LLAYRRLGQSLRRSKSTQQRREQQARHGALLRQGSAMPEVCVIHRDYEQEQNVFENFLGCCSSATPQSDRDQTSERLIIVRTLGHNEPHLIARRILSSSPC
jgi:hypothetical protein